MPKGPALKSLSIDKLVALREQVEATITTKVIEVRVTLQAELGKLSRFFARAEGSGGERPEGAGHKAVGIG
jgi:hypothetical protein